MFVVGGESLIDLVPEAGRAEKVAHAGGSPFNCAIALAKLGNDTGFLCPISEDRYGDMLLAPLAEAGVSVLLTERVPEPTTIADVTLDREGKAQYEFRRGAERALDVDALTRALPPDLKLYQIGGFCPIEPVDAGIWLAVVESALNRGATISIDPNVRPSLVADFGGYKGRLDQFLDLAHIIKMSEEDLELLRPGMPIEDHAKSLLARNNCGLVIVTLGDKGSLAFTQSGHGKAGIYSPPVFGDTVGAGDSLMAGVLTLLNEEGKLNPEGLDALDDAALDRILRFGAVVAGLNCAHKGCYPPTRPEVDAVLAQ
jgi:fructokinase